MMSLEFSVLSLLLVSVFISTTFETKCVQRERQTIGHTPFVFCLKKDTLTWFDDDTQGQTEWDLCTQMSSPSRMRLEDVSIIPVKEKKTNKDNDVCPIYTKLNYEKKFDNCSYNPSLIKVFLEKFSRTHPPKDDVKSLSLSIKDVTTAGKEELIFYEFSCVEDENTIDICHHNTSFFDKTDSVKLFYQPDSKVVSPNCHCYFTSTGNSPITARALDIRLNAHNKLLIDSEILPEKEFYWYRDGILGHPSVSKISLLGLRQDSTPSQVWIQVFGTNLTVSCDVEAHGTGDNDIDSGLDSSSDSGGFNSIFIVAIIIGAVVLLVIMFFMTRCLKKKSNHDGEIEMERYVMAGPMDDTSTNKADDEILITTQAENEYSIPSAQRLKRHKEKKDYPTQSEEEDERSPLKASDRSVDTANSTGQDSGTDDTGSSEPPAFYSHLGDKPDIVPSSPSNIYDTGGKDDYSVLNMHKNSVTTDNIYDVTK